MRMLQTELPLGSWRISGSRVRLPEMVTALMSKALLMAGLPPGGLIVFVRVDLFRVGPSDDWPVQGRVAPVQLHRNPLCRRSRIWSWLTGRERDVAMALQGHCGWARSDPRSQTPPLSSRRHGAVT